MWRSLIEVSAGAFRHPEEHAATDRPLRRVVAPSFIDHHGVCEHVHLDNIRAPNAREDEERVSGDEGDNRHLAYLVRPHPVQVLQRFRGEARQIGEVTNKLPFRETQRPWH